jgi:hypothetical protein
VPRVAFAAASLCLSLSLAAHAQSTPDPAITSTIDRLFDAMKRSDTAAVRAQFLAGGRVIVLPPLGAPADKLTALSLDDFVKFTATNAPGSWIERAWNPVTSTNGTLGQVWFDYDIYRGGALTQCGANSVQLQRAGADWKIVSMAFSARRTDCPPHPAPA